MSPYTLLQLTYVPLILLVSVGLRFLMCIFAIPFLALPLLRRERFEVGEREKTVTLLCSKGVSNK